MSAKRWAGVRRDEAGWPMVQIPAVLAAPAHSCGEESELIVYLAARALDPNGSGRTPREVLVRELLHCWSAKQLGRVIHGAKGCRYWEVEERFLRLRSASEVLNSFRASLIIDSPDAVSFSLGILDSRPRPGAALCAAVVALTGRPRSNAFAARFTSVDRGTRGRWLNDPVIRNEILSKARQWTTV